MSDSTTLARMAASNPFSLLTTDQLNRAGIHGRHLGALVRRGSLHHLRRGFYTCERPNWCTELAAACAQVGRGATVSHRSAARLHGIWNGADIDLTVRHPADARAAGVAIHRSRDLIEADVVTVAGFRTTSLTCTLCDLGLVLPPGEVERLIDHAIATGLVDAGQLWRLRRRVGEHGRTGVGMVDAAIGDLPELAGSTESGPELRLLKLICRSSLPTPVPQHRVRAGGRRYRIDLAYPEQLVAIEYDGLESHGRDEQVEADRIRQRHLEGVGWVVCRYTWDDLAPINVPATLARLRDALGGHRGAGPVTS